MVERNTLQRCPEHCLEQYQGRNRRQIQDHCQAMAAAGWRLVYRGPTDCRHATSAIPPSYTVELHWVRSE